jgi:hypothetical protein
MTRILIARWRLASQRLRRRKLTRGLMLRSGCKRPTALHWTTQWRPLWTRRANCPPLQTARGIAKSVRSPTPIPMADAKHAATTG